MVVLCVLSGMVRGVRCVCACLCVAEVALRSVMRVAASAVLFDQ